MSLFFFIFASALVYVVYSIGQWGMGLVYRGVTQRKLYFSKADIEEVRQILEGFEYYQPLSVKGKAKFLRRVISFMVNKEFWGMKGLKITREMEVTVSAAAVQLTFGLSQFRLLHFHTIKLFPETFYFRLYEKHLKGGASVSGYIFLSWKDVQEGFAKGNDRYNLGLHEMAHALKIDALHGADFDRRFSDRLTDWMGKGIKELDRMREGEEDFLRKYAKTNLHEFFAVSVEHFFEVPEAFSEAMPDLYQAMCTLMNQDPRNKHQDYLLV